MNKKLFWLIVLLILMITGITIFILWPKTKLSEIKIAGVELALTIAEDKGFFKKEGLKIKLEIMPSEDNISALLAGKVDYVIFGKDVKSFIEASLRNAPIKIIMFTAKQRKHFLITRSEFKLKDLKTIGIDSRDTSQRYQILKFIEDNSLKVTTITPKAEKGVTITEKLQDLLLSGKVDAILIQPLLASLLQDQGFTILASITYVSPTGLVIRNDKIEERPEEVQKVVRAIKKAAEFIVTNPEETKNLLLKYSNLEKTEKNFQRIEENYILARNVYDRKNTFYEEVKSFIQLVKAGEFETLQEVEKQVVTQEELDKVFDFRFVE